ncbi:MAG: histidinol-phosphate transaminase [Gammaproteobacteria bacterium]|nr:histidinol-phosphate transaminase [Gammaproteobacteria bacterium]
MSRFWSQIVSKLTPYVPGEQPKTEQLIKLNTNENPYPPSPKVLAALTQEASEQLRLYPDPNADALKQTLADYHQLSPDQVFVGNGSDEVLAHTFQALLKQDKPLLYPEISYSFYPVYCGLYEVNAEKIPLNDKLEIDLEDYRIDNGGIIFPNPNAPTGQLLPLDQIRQLLEFNRNSVVVVDEAYIDFGGQSAASLVNDYPNLLVIQTFSKSRSLAGLRVGFALGHRDLVNGLERVKNSFNSYPLDRFAQAGAVAALHDQRYFEQSCQKIIDSRQWLQQQLEDLGFNVLPSSANFLFVSHPEKDAEQISQSLREQSIIVRHFKQPAEISQYLRITVGTQQECEQLIACMKTL